MIPDEKLATIIDLFLNEEISKASAIKAIQRLADNACAETKSAERSKDRHSQSHYPEANSFERWMRDDEERLMSMRAQGYGYDVIARELRRTTRSVRTKYLEVKQREAQEAQKRVNKTSSK